MQFKGKTILVTGGASGIGEAIVLAFAQRGANVVLTYMTSNSGEVVDKARKFGGGVLAVQADLKMEGAADQAVEAAVSEFGQLDILVANAGGLVKKSRTVDMPLALWDEVIAVNVTTTFLSCRAALRHMEPRRQGCLILISSLAGHNGGAPEATPYGASKGAIITYTRGLAKEVGPLGIRVNGIAPGLIGTRFQDTFNTPEGRKNVIGMTPLRREGTSDDVAGAAVFLASQEASFLAGETIEVNGGYGLY